MTNNNGTQHHVNESADKITVKTKLVRGSGTRDQDKWDIKVRGDDVSEVVDKIDRLVVELGDTADAVRAIQPGEDDG